MICLGKGLPCYLLPCYPDSASMSHVCRGRTPQCPQVICPACISSRLAAQAVGCPAFLDTPAPALPSASLHPAPVSPALTRHPRLPFLLTALHVSSVGHRWRSRASSTARMRSSGCWPTTATAPRGRRAPTGGRWWTYGRGCWCSTGCGARTWCTATSGGAGRNRGETFGTQRSDPIQRDRATCRYGCQAAAAVPVPVTPAAHRLQRTGARNGRLHTSTCCMSIAASARRHHANPHLLAPPPGPAPLPGVAPPPGLCRYEDGLFPRAWRGDCSHCLGHMVHHTQMGDTGPAGPAQRGDLRVAEAAVYVTPADSRWATWGGGCCRTTGRRPSAAAVRLGHGRVLGMAACRFRLGSTTNVSTGLEHTGLEHTVRACALLPGVVLGVAL